MPRALITRPHPQDRFATALDRHTYAVPIVREIPRPSAGRSTHAPRADQSQ